MAVAVLAQGGVPQRTVDLDSVVVCTSEVAQGSHCISRVVYLLYGLCVYLCVVGRRLWSCCNSATLRTDQQPRASLQSASLCSIATSADRRVQTRQHRESARAKHRRSELAGDCIRNRSDLVVALVER
jgi:hypothetical protein